MIPRRILMLATLTLTLAGAAHARAPKPAKAAAAPAPVAAPAEIAAAQRALHAAVAHGTVQDVLTVRARFAALAAAAPKSAWNHYWVAICDWRAAPRFDDKAKDLAEKTCDEGIGEIEKAIALAPAEGEFLAVRSNLLGMSLRFHPASMMTIGPDIEATMQKAVAAAPANPRVQLLNAINTMSKPAFIGGGADQALPLFRKAQALFATATVTDSTAPAWGQDDAWLWAGRAAMELNDAATARDCYRKVLEITPGHAWVEHVLLPEAEKALASADARK